MIAIETQTIDGGMTAPAGFRAAGVAVRDQGEREA